MTNPIVNIAALASSLLLTTCALAQGLPEFTLQCSDSNGLSTYRLVSDSEVIYFANIDNKIDLNDTKKSVGTSVQPREIRMVFQGGDVDKRIFRMARQDDDRFEIQGVLARDTLVLTIGYKNYICQKIDDKQIGKRLKAAYENAVEETIQKQKVDENRPNQL